MKKILLFLILITVLSDIQGQEEVTLQECYQWVSENTPLIKQKQLYEAAFVNQNTIIDKRKMPTVQWNTRAQVQSDALSFELPLPGAEPIELPYFNIQSTIDVGYTILDGGYLKAKSTIEQGKLVSNLQSVEVALYQLKEMVDQYYWGIILLEGQASVLSKGIESIEARISTMDALLENGVILPSAVKKMKAEKLKINNQLLHIQGNQNSLRSLLAAFTGKEIILTAKLLQPKIIKDVFLEKNNRPELTLFDTKIQNILANEELIDAAKQPKLRAFLKAGLGYPSPINLFKTEISPYAIGGLQFSWNIIDWGQGDRQKQQLKIQSEIVQVQKEYFEFNIDNLKRKYQADINAIEKQIRLDKELANIQAEILEEYAVQLDHGVLTPTDYLLQLNEGLRTKLNVEVQLLKIQQLKTAYLTKIGGKL